MNKSKRSQTKNLNVPIASTDDSQIIPENSVDVSNKSSDENNDPFKERRDLILTHKEAQAASPDDMAACGEEDIGAGLEFLVTKDDHHK
ncbi:MULTISPECIES: hypothetical protein [unclassified Methylophaga]|jgi:hypothetical protein|uniref:hypothetical protein n=1 Tax=unclassified Methylophaga TaxID=2629249 RepID=UPI000C9965F9|nr:MULTISPECIES: hypothetical protein [unclassified Methylophaga]MAK65969.1 hypothetical protein [Methylophaga sp.]MAY18654.1 hypothetical protein [Methylophaga sp.]HCD06612.1 hypothetical protein [Methylophaga sp.]|tara:strand:+ start:35326 stop:35592 length:267 start_codon:yes stop_codon:yes gene_type:complete